MLPALAEGPGPDVVLKQLEPGHAPAIPDSRIDALFCGPGTTATTESP